MGPTISKALIALPSFARCDTTCAFQRQGKIKPVKTLQKYSKFIDTFMEKFVCFMYGKACYSDINKLRAGVFRQKFQPKQNKKLTIGPGIDLSLFVSTL